MSVIPNPASRFFQDVLPEELCDIWHRRNPGAADEPHSRRLRDIWFKIMRHQLALRVEERREEYHRRFPSADQAPLDQVKLLIDELSADELEWAVLILVEGRGNARDKLMVGFGSPGPMNENSLEQARQVLREVKAEQTAQMPAELSADGYGASFFQKVLTPRVLQEFREIPVRLADQPPREEIEQHLRAMIGRMDRLQLEMLHARFAFLSADEIGDFLIEMIAQGNADELEHWLRMFRLTPEQVRDYALSLNIVGFALSGGGIRSATFGLGGAQFLAEKRLLSLLDYQSSVSGGGYIGGWLAAWIKREQPVFRPPQPNESVIENVSLQLQPNRRVQARAERPKEPTAGEVVDGEPYPLYHLRAYSNYLAPHLGVFSADGWTMVSTCLRNFFVNQLAFLFMALALWCGIAGVLRIYAAAGQFPWLLHAFADKQAGKNLWDDPDLASCIRVAILTGIMTTIYFLYTTGIGIKLLSPQKPSTGSTGKGFQQWITLQGLRLVMAVAFVAPTAVICYWDLQLIDVWQLVTEGLLVAAALALFAVGKDVFKRIFVTPVAIEGEQQYPVILAYLGVPAVCAIAAFGVAYILSQGVWGMPHFPFTRYFAEASYAGLCCFVMIAADGVIQALFLIPLDIERRPNDKVETDPSYCKQFLWQKVLLPLLAAA